MHKEKRRDRKNTQFLKEPVFLAKVKVFLYLGQGIQEWTK